MRRTTRTLSLLVAVIAAIGCGSSPIPLVATAGSTITITIPKNFTVGFGTAMVGVRPTEQDPRSTDFETPYDPHSIFEDRQRGELGVFLYEGTSNHAAARLPVRFVTRVQLDESSAMALSPLPYRPYPAEGQVIAFVDIPDFVEPGDYSIRIGRYVRDPVEGPFEFTGDMVDFQGGTYPYIAWGGTNPTEAMPIRIEASFENASGSTENYTPFAGTDIYNDDFLTYDFDVAFPDIARMAVPYPAVKIRVAEYDYTGSFTIRSRPAAFEFELEYPRRMVDIKGVSLERMHRSSGIVRFEADPPLDCDEPGDDVGVARIYMADPDVLTVGVRVAFDLVNFQEPCAARATLDDFEIREESVRLYDVDGSPMTVTSELLPSVEEIL